MSRNLPWSPAELDYLSRIGGTDHIVILCKRYCRTAAKNGWTKRSHEAIKDRLSVLGYSLRAEFNGWSGAGLAKILGIRPNRVNDWCQKKKLVCSRVPGTWERRILQSDFQAFAKLYPHCLRDVEELNLRQVLDSETVDLILSQKPPVKAIAVYSSRTGRVYPSIYQAAKNEFFCERTISLAARHNKPAIDGTRFVKINEELVA